MAGPWIKMSCDLDTNPHVIEMASLLSTTEIHVVGMLWKVWSWADLHSIDGNAIRVTNVTLDRFTGVTGFADALRKVGWLEGRDGSLTFPRFAEHNGQTAKNRAETAGRVAKHRNAKSVTNVTPKALPEERRVEKNTGTGAETDFESTKTQKPVRRFAATDCRVPIGNKDAIAAVRCKVFDRAKDRTLQGIPSELGNADVAEWWLGHIGGDPLTGDTVLDLLLVLCSAAKVRKGGYEIRNKPAKLASMLISGEWLSCGTDLGACYKWIQTHMADWVIPPTEAVA